eukprot:gb/GECG01002361.1/.p1 GENE.gb/GECG01002361.1/~~gb/GECG01002361.1/.p1  ORF type:complete len:663 (+),score=106.89 gb/GECG01002361.1/:1-1989(+)
MEGGNSNVNAMEARFRSPMRLQVTGGRDHTSQSMQPSNMGPPPPKMPRRQQEKKRKVVLDEDEWLQRIENIIERHFFPDLQQLQQQKEWLDALKSKDPQKINQAKKRIKTAIREKRHALGETPLATPHSSSSSSAAGASVAGSVRSSAGSATGGSRKRKAKDEWDDLTPLRDTEQHEETRTQEPRHSNAQDSDREDSSNMRLNEFFTKYTSEDNAALDQLLEKVEQEHKRKFWWAYERHDEGPRLQQLTNGTATGHALDALHQQRLEDQKKVRSEITYEGEKPAHVNTWPHRLENHLHNVPDLDNTRDVCALSPSNEQKKLSTGQTTLPLEDRSRTELVRYEPGSSSTALTVPSETINKDGGVSKPKALSFKATRFDGKFLSAQRAKAENATQNQITEEEKEGRNPAVPNYALERPHVAGQNALELDPEQQEEQKSRSANAQSGTTVNGYGFEATPSPMPGAGDGAAVNRTPEVTWGRIDGTPLVIGQGDSATGSNEESDDEEDVDIEKWLEENLLQYRDNNKSSSGFEAASSFSVAEPSQRDIQGRKLADKAKIDRGKLYSNQRKRGLESGARPSETAFGVARQRRDSVSSGGSDTERGKVSGYRSARNVSSLTPSQRLSSLSPAAQSLAKKMGVRRGDTPLSGRNSSRKKASYGKTPTMS